MICFFSWMSNNWRELPEILRFAEEMEASVEVIRLVTPRRYSLFSLLRDELRAVLGEFERQDATMRSALEQLKQLDASALGDLPTELVREYLANATAALSGGEKSAAGPEKAARPRMAKPKAAQRRSPASGARAGPAAPGSRTRSAGAASGLGHDELRLRRLRRR